MKSRKRYLDPVLSIILGIFLLASHSLPLHSTLNTALG